MFTGRIKRRYFLLILAAITVVSITFSVLLASVGETGNSILVLAPILIFSLPLMLLWFSIHIRRFHDIGMSGWLILLPMFFPLASIILGLLPGDKTANKYGKRP